MLRKRTYSKVDVADASEQPLITHPDSKPATSDPASLAKGQTPHEHQDQVDSEALGGVKKGEAVRAGGEGMLDEGRCVAASKRLRK